MCVRAGQLCGEGWHHVGDACLRINSSRESYDNAQHYCKNLGGNIASLLTDKQVNFVLEELHKYQLQDKVGGATGKKGDAAALSLVAMPGAFFLGFYWELVKTESCKFVLLSLYIRISNWIIPDLTHFSKILFCLSVIVPLHLSSWGRKRNN